MGMDHSLSHYRNIIVSILKEVEVGKQYRTKYLFRDKTVRVLQIVADSGPYQSDWDLCCICVMDDKTERTVLRRVSELESIDPT